MPTKPSATKSRTKKKLKDPKPGVLQLDDLIREVADLCDLSDDDAERVVKSIFWSMIKSLHREEPVTVRGFGRFYLKERKAFMNPNRFTGKRFLVPAKKKVFFEPHKYLRYLMNPQLFKEKP